MDLLTCVQSRHGGPYDSELLAVMSPLLVNLHSCIILVNTNASKEVENYNFFVV